MSSETIKESRDLPELSDAQLQTYFESAYTSREKRLFPKFQEMRDHAVHKDMMEDVAGYTPSEMRAMSREMTFFALNDGCTGSCSWCAWMAKNAITSVVSFESFGRYLDEYGKNINVDLPILRMVEKA